MQISCLPKFDSKRLAALINNVSFASRIIRESKRFVKETLTLLIFRPAGLIRFTGAEASRGSALYIDAGREPLPRLRMAKVHLRAAGNFLGEESRLYNEHERAEHLPARLHRISESQPCRFTRIIGAINKDRPVL